MLEQRLKVAVGSLASAANIGDGDDSLGVVDFVEDAPVALAHAVLVVSESEYSPRARLSGEAANLLPDCSKVPATETR